jgi:hypothetical protein
MKEVTEKSSHFTDCLIPAAISSFFTRVGFFRGDDSNASQEISRRSAAFKSLRDLMEQEEVERNIIRLKIFEYSENISHIHNQLLIQNTSSCSSQHEEPTSQKRRAKTEFDCLYDDYIVMIQSYPMTQDYSQLSAADIEAFYDCFSEHHHATMEIAYHLSQVMEDNLRELHQKFMELPPSVFTPTNKK